MNQTEKDTQHINYQIIFKFIPLTLYISKVAKYTACIAYVEKSSIKTEFADYLRRQTTSHRSI